MTKSINKLYEFGPYRLMPAERLLLRNGAPVQLPPKAFETLLALVERSGHLVQKEELMKEVWPDSFVEEGNLTLNISTLRKALQNGAETSGYIETVPKHGYRFSAPVREIPAGTQLIIEKHTFAQTVTDEQETVQDESLVRPISAGRAVLKWIAPVAALLAIVIGVLYVKTRPSDAPAAAARKQVVAVLPLRDAGSDTGIEHLQLGITDAIITKLSNVQGLSIKPPSATRNYFRSTIDGISVGKSLGADAVLEGSLTKFGNQIRVRTQLLRVSDGASIWAETFDDDFTDVFTVEDNISARVAGVLSQKLSPNEERLVRKHYTTNSEAYQLYLKGQYFWQLRDRGLHQALDYFEKAAALDPRFALAYVGIANSQAFSDHESGLWQKGERAARKAIELDPSIAEPHAALGFIHMFQRWDWKAAESEFQQAIALNPNYPTAHHWHALFLAARGHIEQAHLEIKKAEELDPYSLAISADVAQIYYFEKEFGRVAYQCKNVTLPMDAHTTSCFDTFFYAHALQGRLEEAVMNRIQAMKNGGYDVEQDNEVAHQQGARAYLSFMLLRYKQTHPSWHLVAQYYLLLGNKNEALHWLAKAVDAHNFFMVFIKIDPIYDDLRSDPRFKQLERRVGLADS